MEAAGLAALALAIVAGTVSQRVCGMGLGLIAVPVAVFVTGPVLGVFTVNAAAFVVGAAVCWSLRRDILWRRWRILALGALVGTIPGWALVRVLEPAPLEVAIGSVLVVSLAISAGLGPGRRRGAGRWLGVSGAIGGLLNTAVGQAAPVLVVYQRATGWDQATFQATLQPTFLVMNAASLAAKGVGLTLPAPPLPPFLFGAGVLAAAAIGLVAGEWAAPRVSPELARRFAFAVAAAGALVTLARGVVGMF